MNRYIVHMERSETYIIDAEDEPAARAGAHDLWDLEQRSSRPSILDITDDPEFGVDLVELQPVA